LFNNDGTPFVIGTPLDMPVRADGTRLSYDFDPLTGLYVPVTRVANEPAPIITEPSKIYNPDGTPFIPGSAAPLPPPLFNSDGTPFVVGSPLEMPVRADGTRLSYEFDPVTRMYWPTTGGEMLVSSPANPEAGGISKTLVYDPITKTTVSVTYRSAQLAVINPDGSSNDFSKIVLPKITENTTITTVPKREQIGSWAVVDKYGNVVNAIVCTERVCGGDGEWGGKITDPITCPNGCQLVLQVPPNPNTGQSMGGFTTGGDKKVTYKNGEFKVTSSITLPTDTTGKAGSAKTVVRTIKDGVITDVTGEKVDLSTGIQLPSVIKDAALKKQVDADIKAADITPVKTTKGYQLNTDDQLSAIDSTLKIVAVKKGSKAITFKLTVDNLGELFVPTTVDLTGYLIQIQRGSNVLKSVKVS